MSRDAWSTSLSRRGLLLGAAGLGLAGCGFRPLLAPPAQGEAETPLRRELAAIRVAPIGERSGQLFQRYLERRFEGARAGAIAGKYQLAVGYGVVTDIVGYRRDGAVTRIRYTATSDWVLYTMAVPPAELGRDTARTIDAFNIPDNQFFAADSSRIQMEERIIRELGDQVYEGVARELRRWLGAGVTPA